jgi:uncharacterized protein involved in exopolysaccharide biosynthesis
MSPFSQPPLGATTPVGLLDPKGLALLVGYVGRAVLRRKLVAATTFFGTVVLVVLAALWMPRTYRVEARILTNNTDLEEIVNPTRFQSNDPMTKNVVERFLARENMLGLVVDANLEKAWDEQRGVIGEAKDAIRTALFGPIAQKDKEEALYEIAKRKVHLFLEGDIVVCRAEWTDAKTTLTLAQVCEKRFLAMQRERELSQKRESVALLERNVESSQKDLDASYATLEKTIQGKGASVAQLKAVRQRRASAGGGGAGGASKGSLAEVERLKEIRDEKKAVIGDIERNHRATVVQASGALVKLRETLGPDHPDLKQAARVVEEESRPPPELLKLKSEVAQLEAQIDRLSSRGDPPKERGTIVEEVVAVPEGPKDIKDDPEVERMMTNITVAEQGHWELLDRLATAKIEVQTAEAAFAYRYITVYPPLLPKKAVSPNVGGLVGAGVLAAFVLAFLLAIAADVLAMRVMETWQIERFLGLPVLGEIGPP